MTLVERIEALNRLGATVTNDYEYRGKVGTPERKRHMLPETVEAVYLPFTAEEWISVAMREPIAGIESLYVGGCCGNMGVVQDTMSGCFRDGGFLSAEDLQTMGPLLRGHDGWEQFAGDFEVEPFLDPERWGALDPWDKVCVIHATLAEALKLPRYDRPRGEPENEDYEKDKPGRRVIGTLYNTLARIEWSDLFTGDRPYGGSHELQRRLALARIVQPMATLTDLLANEPNEFDGFALVKPGTDEVLDNRSGLCVYDTREAAQEIIDLWSEWETPESQRKSSGEDIHEPEFVKPDCEIVAVTVSVPNGLRVVR